jgi:hypothetical protein
MHIEGELISLVGRVRYVITDGKHVCLSGPELVVRRCVYDVSLHLFQQPTGEWDTQEFGKQPDWHNPYVNRRDNGRRDWDKHPSDSAKKALKAALMSAWSVFIPQHPELLKAAEKEHLEGKILTCEEKITELEQKISVLREEKENIQIKLAHLG